MIKLCRIRKHKFILSLISAIPKQIPLWLIIKRVTKFLSDIDFFNFSLDFSVSSSSDSR